MKVTLIVVVLCAAALGCGAPLNAGVVRATQMTEANMSDPPVWIAFHRGDEIPLYVDVDAAMFEVAPAEPLSVTVKRDFFLLIGDGEPRLSFDRETFIRGGGSFAVGLGNSKDRGPHASVSVRLHADDVRDGLVE